MLAACEPCEAWFASCACLGSSFLEKFDSKTRILETHHLHDDKKIIKNFENCDPSESSPHSRQVGSNACELFEAWLAHWAAPNSIFLEKFDSNNTHLGDTPSP